MIHAVFTVCFSESQTSSYFGTKEQGHSRSVSLSDLEKLFIIKWAIQLQQGVDPYIFAVKYGFVNHGLIPDVDSSFVFALDPELLNQQLITESEAKRMIYILQNAPQGKNFTNQPN